MYFSFIITKKCMTIRTIMFNIFQSYKINSIYFIINRLIKKILLKNNDIKPGISPNKHNKLAVV
jgi:hypothetical protein